MRTFTASFSLSSDGASFFSFAGLGVFGGRFRGAGGVAPDNTAAPLSQFFEPFHVGELAGILGEPTCITDECFGGSILLRLPVFHQGVGLS